ncbi:MAG: class I SAM-dependent methyltransferase, partial [Fibrobacter sp.]|nr:class I SAM-dependent methyltransferase [Fibrobacter sp.]
NMNFLCADCRHLPIKAKFDLVIFLYDGINYLQNLSDYKNLFEQVSSCLNNGGYFLFDITTETNSLRYFTDFLDYEDFGDYFYLRHSYYNKGNSKQHNDFTVFKKKNGSKDYTKFEEHHIQKVFSPELIKKTIKSSNFTTIGIWDDFSFYKYSLNSERIHFLLRKNLS